MGSFFISSNDGLSLIKKASDYFGLIKDFVVLREPFAALEKSDCSSLFWPKLEILAFSFLLGLCYEKGDLSSESSYF